MADWILSTKHSGSIALHRSLRPQFGAIKPQEIKTLVKTVERVEDVLMSSVEALSQNSEKRLLASSFLSVRKGQLGYH
jgi:hypothetical protein